MKTEFTSSVNETRRTCAWKFKRRGGCRIERVALGYSRTAKVPGFRREDAPMSNRQQFRDQILTEVAHDLIPGRWATSCGNMVSADRHTGRRDVTIEAGQPLTFTTSFDTVPAFEPGDYSTIALRQPSSKVEDEAVADALRATRQRAALSSRSKAGASSTRRHGPRCRPRRRAPAARRTPAAGSAWSWAPRPARQGFDQARRSRIGCEQDVRDPFPAKPPFRRARRADAAATGDREQHQKRVIPALDDEFAKDLGRVRQRLEALQSCACGRISGTKHGAGPRKREVQAELIRSSFTPGGCPRSKCRRRSSSAKIGRRIRGLRGDG